MRPPACSTLRRLTPSSRLLCSATNLFQSLINTLSITPPPNNFTSPSVFPSLSQLKIQRTFFFFLAALLTMINRCWWSLPYTTSLVKFRAALRLANLRRGWARTRSVGCRRGQVLGRKGAPIFGRLSGSAGFGAASRTEAVGSVRGTSQRALRGPGGCREHASLRQVTFKNKYIYM